MEENKGVPLSSIIKEFKLEVLSQSSQFDKTKIQVTSINRPGLQLMGYYDYFDEKRVQLLGKAEYSYMRTMTADQRFTFFDSLFSRGIPALIIARDLEIFPECYRAAERQDCTVLRTNQVTGEFMSDLTAALRSHLAPRITRHGVLMEVYGEEPTNVSGLILVMSTASSAMRRWPCLIRSMAVSLLPTPDSPMSRTPSP